ncbi:uncharacterized protein EV420DRAFT_434643 [Desarmillaria tabescens]|uniref:Uncharacterized protein n=1 Tax=Armillaria tabescens TaxID=1929756 RepID=A0AA39U6F5_ARMTA|nr:uncharacterized protein EV420DRAFT_434643 [Desarmillaria tabescens]KAK0467910.1 hypothetical protein EV420DRAFT_434643 [Desarmillaria tabescens]
MDLLHPDHNYWQRYRFLVDFRHSIQRIILHRDDSGLLLHLYDDMEISNGSCIMPFCRCLLNSHKLLFDRYADQIFFVIYRGLDMQMETSPKNFTFVMSPLVNIGLTTYSHTDQACTPNGVQTEIADAKKSEGEAVKNTTNALDLPSWSTLHVASSEPSDNGLHLPDENGDELDADGSIDSELFREQKGLQVHETTDTMNSGRNSSSGLFTEPEFSVAPSTPPKQVASVSRVPRSPSKFIGVIIPRSAHSTPNRHGSLCTPSITTAKLVPKSVRDGASGPAIAQHDINIPIPLQSGTKTPGSGIDVPPHTLTTIAPGPVVAREEPAVHHGESLVGALTAAFSQNAKMNNALATTAKDTPVLNDRPPKITPATPPQERPVRYRTKIQKHVHFDPDDIEEWLETDYASIQDHSSIPSSKELLEVTLEALRQVRTSHDAPERTQKRWENDPKSLTENYLSRVGDWFGEEALKNVKLMGRKPPKASTKSARSREMSVEVDTPTNEVVEENVGTYLGKRKRPDDATDKQAPVEVSALQDSLDADTDTLQTERIESMEKTGFSESSVSLIQKLVKGKRAMEPKELRELHIFLSDIKRMGENVNWSGVSILLIVTDCHWNITCRALAG